MTTTSAAADVAATKDGADGRLVDLLDAPLLFVKRHSYRGIHIYDTYYKWGPGGGIYVLENPTAPPSEHEVRAVVDATTLGSPGAGVYSDPELSWDATRLLFCFKGEKNGSTSIWEIGIDGSGLRRLTDTTRCRSTAGRHGTHHDVGPAYLADGRITFTSTRPRGLVPCANSGVDILHVMSADGEDIRPISINPVNEFDPSILPDGRVLYGRWEYVDKTALTQQSLWVISPDGTTETAVYANNMVHPEAVLDARTVPGAPHLVAGSLTPHNAPPRGTIAIIDMYAGKNNPAAITNFEHPNNPTYDRGNSCEPWPLSKDVILFSGRPAGNKFNVIELIDRSGRREVVFSDPQICCHSPMLVKPRALPPTLSSDVDEEERMGRFYVQDVYQGLDGVKEGEVKWLRVAEETSRASGTHGSALNQTFLISAVLAWAPKNFLGVVPVEADGSAYFEVPSKRAVFLQALDADGRMIQSMRTYVQASPGVTRSCIGCHEHKYSTPAATGEPTIALQRDPSELQPESWGSGFIDYTSMVQPIFDRRCVRCHGGEEGIGAGLDLTGGWTQYFNISYENLVNRRDTQVTASLIAGIDCMNGTARWSAQIFPPRSHGSGAAPLAKLLVDGHDGYVEDLTRAERDLILAWIDTNGLFHGTWNYAKGGHQIASWPGMKKTLATEMEKAGCGRCHDTKAGDPFDNDWVNLRRPELSRILRAPLAAGAKGFGLGSCRGQKVNPAYRRLTYLVDNRYSHGDLPVETFKRKVIPATAGDGSATVATFESTDAAGYQAMLAIIRAERERALSKPRVDMPGADVVAGECRMFLPPPVPKQAPPLTATLDEKGGVDLRWSLSAGVVGLDCEVHRGSEPNFTPGDATRIASTLAGRHLDQPATAGRQHYALVVTGAGRRSAPARVSIDVR